MTLLRHQLTVPQPRRELAEDCGFRRRRTLIPKGTRTAFRAEGEQFSERSDAGSSIVQEVFGFVKENLSGAQRRQAAAGGERGAGKGAAALVPASAHRDPGERQLDGCGPRFLRIESPRISMRWALWTSRSRMPSAAVGSPICSCQRATGSCEVRIVERV